jgi:peptidyl-prolyl cis-trans isomerase A (cyclophilin A)
MIAKHFIVAASVLALASCSSNSSQSRAANLLNPSPADLAKPAPDSFKVQFETSKGHFTVMAYRAWAPLGTDRFYYLVSNEFYDGARFFRTLPNFVVQFGLNGNPEISKVWRERSIQDDSVRQSNQAGYITYAKGGPNSRTTQIFINKVDNSRLDAMGFAPFAKVIDGMHVIEQFYGGYGDGGRGGPDQTMIGTQGNGYLDRQFPRLDSIVKARVIK